MSATTEPTPMDLTAERDHLRKELAQTVSQAQSYSDHSESWNW